MEKAFTELINSNRGIIFKVCNLYASAKDYREDLFQDIVIQLWRAFPSFRKESLPSTWVYRIALNTAVSHFRKENRQVLHRTISLESFELADIPPLLDRNEHEMLLRHAIEKLTRIEKAIILLYLEEKSYEEISEIIGISKNHVGVKLSRIKTKLEKLIKTQEHDTRRP